MTDVTLTTDVTLNGQTADVTVYEDVGNTGSIDNQETVTGVADGVNTYTLTSLEHGTGNAYWLEPSLSTSDVTASSVVNSLSLDVPVPGSVGTTVNGVSATKNGVRETK